MSPFWILLELRMMEVVITTGAVRRASCKAPVSSSPPINQHSHRLDALPFAHPTVSVSLCFEMAAKICVKLTG